MLWTLFWTFFRIGAFTFGGGYAMLPLIQEEVTTRGWLQAQELVNFIAVSESTPGPFAVNISTYVGAEVAGLPGALCATLGVVTPSFLIILLVARCYEKFRTSFLVRGCMSGLKPAVVGLIAAAAISVAGTVFFPAGLRLPIHVSADFPVLVLTFLLMTVLAFKKVHPILILCLSAAIGIGVGYLFL